MKLLENLRNKKHSIGPFSKFSDPAIIECIGMAGFDFVIIDLEHGSNSFETAQNLIRAAVIHGLTPIIRVRKNGDTLISKALDIGALGVQVPQINSAEDAVQAIRAAKFAPLGNRGVCHYVRSAGYSSIEKQAFFDSSNKNTLVILQLEGKRGVDNIDQILQVEDFDILFIGPYDLSQSMGVPGQTNHPRVLEAMKQVVEKATKANKVVGTFVESPEELNMWREMGVLFLSYQVDVGIFYDACITIVKKLSYL